VRIAGTGVRLASRVIESEDLDRTHGRPVGTTRARSAVARRRWVSDDETSSVLAADAVREALATAGLPPGSLDAVIVAGVLPEQPMPTTSALVLGRLGLDGGRAAAFDVNSSCLGFLTGLEIATIGVAAGRWKRVAVAAAEIASKGLDHADVESSALFGDGAGAAVVSRAGPADASAVLALRFATWPEGAGFCRIDAGGTRWNALTPPPDPAAYLFRMDGRGVLRHAAARLPAFIAAVLDEAGLTRADLDVVVPHQASGAGMRLLRERLGFAADQVVDVLAETGNLVSASIPNALHAAVASGRLRRGGHAMLLGTGAGFSIGAAVVRF
jgi:3-oxoacyl-[acyl-carrier-protein] synthase-3